MDRVSETQLQFKLNNLAVKGLIKICQRQRLRTDVRYRRQGVQGGGDSAFVWKAISKHHTSWNDYTPRKHKALSQCWSGVGLISQKLGQCQSNIGSTSHVYWVISDIIWTGLDCSMVLIAEPLVRLRKRWPKLDTHRRANRWQYFTKMT